MKIVYTEAIPQQYAGLFEPPWTIKIRPAYRMDAGLLEHEKEHYRQFCRTVGLHVLLYAWVPRYRLWAEVQAYKVQLKYPRGSAALFAKFISEDYGLDISPEKALALLLA